MEDKLHSQIVQACARIPDQLEFRWAHRINGRSVQGRREQFGDVNLLHSPVRVETDRLNHLPRDTRFSFRVGIWRDGVAIAINHGDEFTVFVEQTCTSEDFA